MEAGDSADNANELTQLVQTMLTQMQSRFQTMSDNLEDMRSQGHQRIFRRTFSQYWFT